MKWQFRELSFKEIMCSYDGTLESLKATNNTLAHLLETNPVYNGFPQRSIKLLEKAETETQTNAVIAEVYDFADSNRIWLGVMECE